jgi:molybdenum cofactor cytidylyltransferase
VITAVVLAAGAASRFGSQKLLAPFHGAALIRRTVENVLASQVSETLVVLGRDGEGVRRALAGLPVRFVTNLDFRSGLSTSLRAGVEAIEPSTLAAIILLGDQPGVTADIVDQLIEEGRRSRRPIVVPEYAGTRGNPVMFDAMIFPELRTIEGDQGARAVIARDPARVATVCFSFEMPADVDTPEDYARLTNQPESPGFRGNPSDPLSL